MFKPLRVAIAIGLAMLACLPALHASAQQQRVYRVGVLTLGGPYLAAFDGLREGLKELGLEEGKQLIFHIRDVRGDPRALEPAAQGLERERVDLIYSITTSVTVAAKKATRDVPIVFYAGTDPVGVGLVASFAQPGGRITGIHSRSSPLVMKRIELMKEIHPGLRKVLFVYDPANPTMQQPLRLARDAARQLNIELVERYVKSVEDLRVTLQALKPGDMDALSFTDAMVTSQEAVILQAAAAKKLMVIVAERASVAKGALASYGVSYFANGRLAARQVQRILQGTSPAVLPVEQADRLHLALNLRTAAALGLKIPSSVLARADEVID